MKLLPLVTLCFTLPLIAQDAPVPAAPAAEPKKAESKKAPLPDFIRYAEGETDARLETAVKSYRTPEGVTVDLVGVVHIADASYYKKLNELLATYDAVLYELVGDPDALKKSPTAKAPPPNPLRNIQKLAGSLLKLSFQLDQIDYTKANFVHADLTAEQFAEMQAEKGENLMTLMARAIKMQNKGGLGVDDKDLNMDMGQILGALSGNGGADALKIVMAKVFDQAETMIENFEGPEEKGGTVLLTERNKVVSEKLQEAVKSGKKKIAVFYGAGHLPGLEGLIHDQQFKQEKEEWLAAWSMKKTAKP